MRESRHIRTKTLLQQKEEMRVSECPASLCTTKADGAGGQCDGRAEPHDGHRRAGGLAECAGELRRIACRALDIRPAARGIL